MMKENMQITTALIARLRKMDKGFASTGVFTQKSMHSAAAVEGIVLKSNWPAAMDKQPGRGLYKLPSGEIQSRVAVVPRQAKSLMNNSKPAFVQVESTAVVPILNERKVSRNNSFAGVPLLDAEYVPYGNYKSIEKIVKSRRFFPFLITGHSGNGKTSQIFHICAKNKIPLIKLSITKASNEESLIGSRTLIDGNVVIEEGPVLIAARSGAVLLLDEIDAGDPNNLMCLQAILEGKPVYFGLSGEWITPAPGFNIVMTGNTKGKGSDDGRYIGTQVLNDAFLDRVAVTFEQEFAPAHIERKMIINWMNRADCLDETFADELVKWADAVRKTFKDGAIDELIATRRLEHIVNAFSIYGDKRQSVELACNRFDTMTKSAFVQLFDKIATENTPNTQEDVDQSQIHIEASGNLTC
jgi:hypothetical protein